jgi:hypothetical protein
MERSVALTPSNAVRVLSLVPPGWLVLLSVAMLGGNSPDEPLEIIFDALQARIGLVDGFGNGFGDLAQRFRLPVLDLSDFSQDGGCSGQIGLDAVESLVWRHWSALVFRGTEERALRIFRG